MAEVRLQDISKTYPGKVTALEPIDLVARDGELLVLVGPSGCGKSTLLRIIAGLEAPDAGHVLIGDDDITKSAPKERDVAMVFQNYALYPHMTVFDNMAFGLKMRRTPKDVMILKVSAAADILGITHLLQRKPGALSGGQRQRVALGRAIVREPRVFLLDEPLSNLDAVLRTQMRTELVRIHRRLKRTMIYVTHDQTEAMTMGDRIAVMSEGQVLQLGSPSEVYGTPASTFVARFIGSPPMNIWSGTVTADGGVQISTGGPELQPPPSLKILIRDRRGTAILAGARPQGMTSVTERPSLPHFAGTVDIEESTGAEVFLRVTTACGELVVRSPDGGKARTGDEVFVEVPPESLHFFDPESQARLE